MFEVVTIQAPVWVLVAFGTMLLLRAGLDCYRHKLRDELLRLVDEMRKSP